MSKAMPHLAESGLGRFLKSVWFFPSVGAVVVILLTLLQISGSSIGVYNTFFYGNRKDPDLLLNRPRPIRSDEWLTNTQMTIAQKNNGFARVNQNIGNGQDMSIILDVPYKDWSTLFKPQNWAFFVMPLGYALAFKWWLMAFLLVMACYFFVLFLLPRQRLFAALFSLALLFSPFVQWWYQFITLGPIYYSLLLMLVFGYLMKAKKHSHELLLGAAFAYLLASFILIFYPPFQIACGLVAGAFMVGYLIENLPKLKRPQLVAKLCVLGVAAVIAGAIALIFVQGNSAAVSATQHSVYPGHRVVQNGGFDDVRLLSSNLAFQFQFTSKASAYYFPTRGIANQSESSNFLYIMPFLFLPAIVLLAADYRRSKRIDWPLLSATILFILFMMRLFFAHFDGLFKVLLLDNVPHNRLIIGTGFLGIVYFFLVVRNLSNLKHKPFIRYQTLIYSLAVFVFQILLGMAVRSRSPGFINQPEIVLFALPFAVIVYLLLERRFNLAVAGLLLFSLFCAGAINPLYKGVGTLTQTPLSQTIQSLARHSNKRWVTESIVLENYAIMNGARSLSGTYSYPQLELWKSIPAANPADYNRFAHVDFKFGSTTSANAPTSLFLRGGDNFVVTTEPCSAYMKAEDVGFILTEKRLGDPGGCATLAKTIDYPNNDFYIYKLN